MNKEVGPGPDCGSGPQDISPELTHHAFTPLLPVSRGRTRWSFGEVSPIVKLRVFQRVRCFVRWRGGVGFHPCPKV